jgi:hypothetical protein
MEKNETIDDLIAEIEAFFKRAVEQCCGKKGSCENCCAGCAESNAHFDFDGKLPGKKKSDHNGITKIPEAALQLTCLKNIYGWSDTTGFLTERGCRLPRSIRSVYCQEVQCKYIGDILKDADWNKLYGNLAKIKEYRTEMRMLI